jgi:beta-glucosidase/6-phospho-beta-glucosidase/beta-galactosidase
MPVIPQDPTSEAQKKAAQNLFYLWSQAFLDAVCLGKHDPELDGSATYRQDLDRRMDFVGINYYHQWSTASLDQPLLNDYSPLATFDPLKVKTTLLYPKGLFEMILFVKEHYALPAMVTENGQRVEGDATAVEAYLVTHLHWMLEAQKQGAQLLGYFYWTLMDNYEWNHGMDWKFGLYQVDPADPKKKRVPRPLVDTYRQIAETRQIPKDLEAAYLAPEGP